MLGRDEESGGQPTRTLQSRTMECHRLGAGSLLALSCWPRSSDQDQKLEMLDSGAENLSLCRRQTQPGKIHQSTLQLSITLESQELSDCRQGKS